MSENDWKDTSTDSIKINRPFMYSKIFFEKTLIEVCSPHLFASFGTFCVKIGQFLESQ